MGRKETEINLYKSPIETMYEQPQFITEIEQKVRSGFDSAVMTVVRRVGVNVDREELLKALAYDRNQYKTGYLDGLSDGRRARDSEIVRCKDCKHRQQYDCNNITLVGTKCGVTDEWFCADGERKENENG